MAPLDLSAKAESRGAQQPGSEGRCFKYVFPHRPCTAFLGRLPVLAQAPLPILGRRLLEGQRGPFDMGRPKVAGTGCRGARSRRRQPLTGRSGIRRWFGVAVGPFGLRRAHGVSVSSHEGPRPEASQPWRSAVPKGHRAGAPRRPSAAGTEGAWATGHCACLNLGLPARGGTPTQGLWCGLGSGKQVLPSSRIPGIRSRHRVIVGDPPVCGRGESLR